MPTNLVISGGPVHDFDASTAALVDVLDATGTRSTVFDDPDEALRALAEGAGAWDLVTVNALRWQMATDRHAHLRERWAFAISDEQAHALADHVAGGGGLLACHTAAICFDGHPRWRSLLGGAWNWDRSSHPPPGPTRIVPTAAAADHPITHGTPPFTVVDEVYAWLDLDADVVPLLTGSHDGTDHPVLWARDGRPGRVVVDLLGHDADAVRHPDHARILRRAARWLTSPRRTPPPEPQRSTPT